MFSIIFSVVLVSGLLAFIFFIWYDFAKIPFETHKEMNERWYEGLETHNDLNRFLFEFDCIKSELCASKTNIFEHSLFHNNSKNDRYASMNANIFRINNVKYVAKDFSDYRKATKVIEEHLNYCKKNNIYCNWI